MMGAGGIGVSALARLYHARGARVTGCDRKDAAVLKDLAAEGIRIVREREILCGDYDCVIHSTAVPENHPVLRRFREAKRPVLKRGQALCALINRGPSVAVTGSHGKTTITFMVGRLLAAAGMRPDVYAGGIDPETGSNFIAGGGAWLVAELDESDRTFYEGRPSILVISNMDWEHVDVYRDARAHREAFRTVIEKTGAGTRLVVNADDAELRKMCREHFPGRSLFECGFSEKSDYRVLEWREGKRGLELKLAGPGKTFECEAPVFGRHNAVNMTLAIAAADLAGASADAIASGFRSFPGVARRFEVLGVIPGGGLLISDYGHHPAEIRAVLETARNRFPGRRLVAVFEPHRFSRLRAFWDDFRRALSKADMVLLADVYGAGETGDAETLKARLAEAIGGEKSRPLPTAEVPEALGEFRSGEIVVCFSAGPLDAVVRGRS
jgi:UDP-N-acetylmuramate--alanine ligase